MNKWIYIFASVCVLSVAMVMAAYSPAESQQKRQASYMIAAEQGNFIWRVNVSDGSVSFCQRESVTTSSAEYLTRIKPICSSPSAAAGH
jgi:hypothetical protein